MSGTRVRQLLGFDSRFPRFESVSGVLLPMQLFLFGRESFPASLGGFRYIAPQGSGDTRHVGLALDVHLPWDQVVRGDVLTEQDEGVARSGDVAWECFASMRDSVRFQGWHSVRYYREWIG